LWNWTFTLSLRWISRKDKWKLIRIKAASWRYTDLLFSLWLTKLLGSRYKSLVRDKKRQMCAGYVFIKSQLVAGFLFGSSLTCSHTLQSLTGTKPPGYYKFIRGYIPDYQEHAAKICLPGYGRSWFPGSSTVIQKNEWSHSRVHEHVFWTVTRSRKAKILKK